MSATATLSEPEVRRELDGFFTERVLAEKLVDSAQGRLEVARLHAEAILRYMTQASRKPESLWRPSTNQNL